MLRYGVAVTAALCAEKLQFQWLNLKFGPAMRQLRKARAMDQYELARRSGLSQPFLSQLETGHADPRWATIARVYYALDSLPLLLPQPRNDWPRLPAQWREEPDL